MHGMINIPYSTTTLKSRSFTKIYKYKSVSKTVISKLVSLENRAMVQKCQVLKQWANYFANRREYNHPYEEICRGQRLFKVGKLKERKEKEKRRRSSIQYSQKHVHECVHHVCVPCRATRIQSTRHYSGGERRPPDPHEAQKLTSIQAQHCVSDGAEDSSAHHLSSFVPCWLLLLLSMVNYGYGCLAVPEQRSFSSCSCRRLLVLLIEQFREQERGSSDE